MIKVEIDSVSMRGNTPVLVMELALAMKSLRESLAKRYGEVATEELISRAMEASKAEGDINEIMSDLIDDPTYVENDNDEYVEATATEMNEPEAQAPQAEPQDTQNTQNSVQDPQPAPAENPQPEMNAAEAALFGSFK